MANIKTSASAREMDGAASGSYKRAGDKAEGRGAAL